MKLGEIFVDLVVKADTYKIREFAKSIADMLFNMSAAGAKLGGLDLSFMSLTSSTLDMGTALRMFHSQTGLSTDELERWQMVARRVGVDNSVVTSSFQRMIGAIAQLKTFGTGPAGLAFAGLGITNYMQKSPYEIMQDIRARYQTMDRQRFMQFAGNIIDPQMTQLFESPMTQPSNLRRLNPLLGESGKRSAADLTAALSRMADVMRGEFLQVFKRIEPDMASIAKFLGIIVEGLGWVVDKNVKGYGGIVDFVKKEKGHFWGDVATVFSGDHFPSTNKNLWQPSAGRVTVNQHFYGDVDKNDIDSGTLSLEHSLIRASRQLNRGGR